MIVRPLKNRSYAETLVVYNQIHEEFTKKGFKLKLHILDNEKIK